MKRVIHTNSCPPSAKYQSQAIATEFFIFLSGFLATDYKTGLATEAAVAPNLPLCGPTAMTRQTKYNLYCMGNVLKATGADFDDLIRIEQFMIGKDQAPWYSLARRAIMDRQHPTSTRACAVGLEVPDALIVTDAIALNPAGGLLKKSHDLQAVPKSITGYPAAYSAGPFFFLPGMVATDWETGLAPEARADTNFWIHSPIKRQTEFVLRKMKKCLGEMGLSEKDVVQSSVYLTDMNDLPGLDYVWRSFFPENPPARVIFPCDGLGVAETIVEISFIALRADDRFPRQTISASSVPEPLFHEPHAVKVGPYLFLSTQISADENGPAAQPNPKLPYYSSQIKNEIEYVLKNTEAICHAAGGSLQDIVRSQSVFLDMADLHPAFEVWREAFPSDPPVNTSAQVGGPMAVPGCRVTKSLVAYIP